MACLCPRNSISNVVASVTTHDDIKKHKMEVDVAENMKPLWKVINYIHVTLRCTLTVTFTLILTHTLYTYTSTYAYTHVHLRLRVRVARGGRGEGRGGEWCWVGRWVGGLVEYVLVFVSVVLVFGVFVLVFPQDS